MSHFNMHLSYIRDYFGYPRRQPARDPTEVATAVIQGDGKSDEAAAAVAYWCDYSQQEAEQFVYDLRREWTARVEASLFGPRRNALGLDRNDEPAAPADRVE